MSDSANQSFRVFGLDCAEEVAVLKRELGPLVGGESNLGFDVLQGKLLVLAPTSAVAEQDVIAAIARTGMRAQSWEASADANEQTSYWQRRGRSLLTMASGCLLVVGFLVHVVSAGSLTAVWESADATLPWTARLLYLLAALAGGWYVLPKAWYSLRSLRPDMNLLMVVAVAGAMAIGQWQEGAVVAFLFAVSLVLESWSVGRARRAVARLLELTPTTARRLAADGSVEEVPPYEVRPGTRLLVKPGERIPLDAEIMRGESDVNEAPITGESMPVAKAPGALVFAGTINGSGALELSTTREACDSTLAHIVDMVESAHARRGPSEQWVERFSRIYTPTILAAALLIAVVPPLVLGGGFTLWWYRALVLLVIGCPCALVISTPMSIVAGLACAAHHGVLIKGGVFLELPARLNAIALDKTGTVTLGKPTVVRVVPLADHTEEELLSRAAALEAQSTHPLARAIADYARQRGVSIEHAEDATALEGRGMTARVAGREYWLGSNRYLVERGQDTPEVRSALEAAAERGESTVVVGTPHHVCGLLFVADTIRPQATETIRQLRAAGIQHIALLTGDSRVVAEAVGQAVGVDLVYAELLPEDKVAVLDGLIDKYQRVAMVGDGVNDAPALARATLGVAMGAAGSDAAIETADVALMSDDLGKLPWLVRHSRRTIAIIWQNTAFALGVKALFVLLNVLGHASLWSAIAADMGASLLVILNGLRLLSDPQIRDPQSQGTGRPMNASKTAGENV